MSLTAGPIMFLTSGSRESLAALPGVATFASAAGCDLKVVHISNSPQPQVATAVRSLYNGASPEVIVTPSLDATVASFESEVDGMVSLLPSRAAWPLSTIVSSGYERLLRRGPLPVLALPKSGKIQRIRKVLFPLDLSPRSDAWFDEVVGLCLNFEAELHLLHVFGSDQLPQSERDMERRRAAKSPTELLNIDKERIHSFQQRANARGVRTVTRMTEGRAHTQILNYAADAGIDVIMMVTHGPRTLEDRLLGSTTARVIRAAPLPVLAMHSRQLAG